VARSSPRPPVKADGRKLVFEIIVRDARQVVAEGRSSASSSTGAAS